jgi:hypothetical protein
MEGEKFPTEEQISKILESIEGHSLRIMFWYTEYKELEYLLQTSEFKNFINRTIKEDGIEFDYVIYKLYAIKSNKVLWNLRALRYSKVLLSQSFYKNITENDILDFFNPIAQRHRLISGDIGVVDFTVDSWTNELLGYSITNETCLRKGGML